MTRNVIVGLLLVGTFAAGAGTAYAVGGPSGAEEVGRYFESYKMALSLRADGTAGTPKNLDDERAVLHLPSHFGELVSITPHGAADVFWYRDRTGALRNVVIDQAADRAVHVRTANSEITETRYR